MADYYTLNGKIPVECEDHLFWIEQIRNNDRRVALSETEEVSVSTVFVGVNMSFEDGVEDLFETMVFGGRLDGEQYRSNTWSEAEEMHKTICSKVGIEYMRS